MIGLLQGTGTNYDGILQALFVVGMEAETNAAGELAEVLMPPRGGHSITVQVCLLLRAICEHASAATSQSTPSPLFDRLDITRLRSAGTCTTTPQCWRPRPSSACRCGLHQCMAASNADAFLWDFCACTLS